MDLSHTRRGCEEQLPGAKMAKTPFENEVGGKAQK
jgi:hypothetical protein